MQLERRNYKRQDFDLFIQVKGENCDGHPFVEMARLLNISGGGAQFISSTSQNYFQGQVLETSVVLPETREVKGSLNTTATVIRLSQETLPDTTDTNISISVSFKRHFKLKRTKTSV